MRQSETCHKEPEAGLSRETAAFLHLFGASRTVHVFCRTLRVRHTEPETLKAERGGAEVLSVAAGWAPWFSFLSPPCIDYWLNIWRILFIQQSILREGNPLLGISCPNVSRRL